MAFRVELARRATRDMAHIYGYINAEESLAAARWFVGLEETILQLEVAPRIGTVTAENSAHRQFIYGHKPHFDRIIYKLDESAGLVTVLQILHGRRRRPGNP